MGPPLPNMLSRPCGVYACHEGGGGGGRLCSGGACAFSHSSTRAHTLQKTRHMHRKRKPRAPRCDTRCSPALRAGPGVLCGRSGWNARWVSGGPHGVHWVRGFGRSGFALSQHITGNGTWGSQEWTSRASLVDASKPQIRGLCALLSHTLQRAALQPERLGPPPSLQPSADGAAA